MHHILCRKRFSPEQSFQTESIWNSNQECHQGILGPMKRYDIGPPPPQATPTMSICCNHTCKTQSAHSELYITLLIMLFQSNYCTIFTVSCEKITSPHQSEALSNKSFNVMRFAFKRVIDNYITLSHYSPYNRQ